MTRVIAITRRAARISSELDEIIAPWTATLGTRELLALLETARRALGIDLSHGRHARRPALRGARGHRHTPHPHFGTLRMQNVAPRLSATPGSIRTPAPEIGQHNAEMYRELLGLDDSGTRRVPRQRA